MKERKIRTILTPYRIHLMIYLLGAFAGIAPILLLLILVVLLKQKLDWERDLWTAIKLLIILWLIQLVFNFVADVFNLLNGVIDIEAFYHISEAVRNWCGWGATIAQYIIVGIMIIKGILPISKR